MFDNISREQFRIDTVLPAIQTATTFIGTQVLGRLGHYSFSAQTTAVVTIPATLLSSLANNFFTKTLYQYLAIPVGVAVGVLSHRFFYPGNNLDAIANVKEIVIISAFLVTVKAIAENIHRLREIGKDGEKKVLQGVEKVAEGVEAGAKKIDEAAKAKVEELEKDKK